MSAPTRKLLSAIAALWRAACSRLSIFPETYYPKPRPIPRRGADYRGCDKDGIPVWVRRPEAEATFMGASPDRGRDVLDRLGRSIVTASNDDYTKPMTTERSRHVARLEAMQGGIDEITRMRETLDAAWELVGEIDDRVLEDIREVNRHAGAGIDLDNIPDDCEATITITFGEIRKLLDLVKPRPERPMSEKERARTKACMKIPVDGIGTLPVTIIRSGSNT